MNERTQYKHLQPEERLTIASLHLQGSSIRAMARILGRSPATVSRELTRNSCSSGYASVPAENAQRRAPERGSPARKALPARRLLACRSYPARVEMVAPADIGHTCENTNGLLRQYLPKGTDLSVYSQDVLERGLPALAPSDFVVFDSLAVVFASASFFSFEQETPSQLS